MVGGLYLAERLLIGSYDWRVGLSSGILFVAGFVLVYIRSGRTVAEDIKNITKHGQR
jgi:hypothetical protein